MLLIDALNRLKKTNTRLYDIVHIWYSKYDVHQFFKKIKRWRIMQVVLRVFASLFTIGILPLTYYLWAVRKAQTASDPIHKNFVTKPLVDTQELLDATLCAVKNVQKSKSDIDQQSDKDESSSKSQDVFHNEFFQVLFKTKILEHLSETDKAELKSLFEREKNWKKIYSDLQIAIITMTSDSNSVSLLKKELLTINPDYTLKAIVKEISKQIPRSSIKPVDIYRSKVNVLKQIDALQEQIMKSLSKNEEKQTVIRQNGCEYEKRAEPTLLYYLLRRYINNHFKLMLDDIDLDFCESDCVALKEAVQQISLLYRQIGMGDETLVSEVLEKIVMDASYLRVNRKPYDASVEAINFFKLLEKAFVHLRAEKDRDLVLFMGPTGAGKSTSINYLSGFKVQEVGKKYGQTLLDVCEEEKRNKNYAEVGHEVGVSETAFVKGYDIHKKRDDLLTDNVALVDCPGFDETRGIIFDLCREISIDHAVKDAGSVRSVVLTVPYEHFILDRGNAIITLFDQLLSRFPNAIRDNEVDDSFYLLITKHSKFPDAKNNLEAMLKEYYNAVKIRHETAQQEGDYNQTYELSRKVKVWKSLCRMSQIGKIHCVDVNSSIKRTEILRQIVRSPGINKSELQNGMWQMKLLQKLNFFVHVEAYSWEGDYSLINRYITGIPKRISDLQNTEPVSAMRITHIRDQLKECKENITRYKQYEREAIEAGRDASLYTDWIERDVKKIPGLKSELVSLEEKLKAEKAEIQMDIQESIDEKKLLALIIKENLKTVDLLRYLISMLSSGEFYGDDMERKGKTINVEGMLEQAKKFAVYYDQHRERMIAECEKDLGITLDKTAPPTFKRRKRGYGKVKKQHQSLERPAKPNYIDILLNANTVQCLTKDVQDSLKSLLEKEPDWVVLYDAIKKMVDGEDGLEQIEAELLQLDQDYTLISVLKEITENNARIHQSGYSDSNGLKLAALKKIDTKTSQVVLLLAQNTALLDQLLEAAYINKKRICDVVDVASQNIEVKTLIDHIAALYQSLGVDKDAKGFKFLRGIILRANFDRLVGFKNSARVLNTITLLQKAFAYLRPISEKNLVLFMGETGAGKSTLINYFSGLKLKNVGKKFGLDLFDVPDDEKGKGNYAKVGHSIGTSETVFVEGYDVLEERQGIPTENLKLVDCPGFDDTRGVDYDLTRALSIDQAVNNARRIKAVVLTVPYPTFKSDRGSKVIDLFEKLLERVPNILDGNNINSLFVSVTKHSRYEDASETFGNMIREFLLGAEKSVNDVVQNHSPDADKIRNRFKIWQALFNMMQKNQIHFVDVKNPIAKTRVLKQYVTAPGIEKNKFVSSVGKNNFNQLFGDKIKQGVLVLLNNILKPFYNLMRTEVDKSTQFDKVKQLAVVIDAQLDVIKHLQSLVNHLLSDGNKPFGQGGYDVELHNLCVEFREFCDSHLEEIVKACRKELAVVDIARHTEISRIKPGAKGKESKEPSPAPVSVEL